MGLAPDALRTPIDVAMGRRRARQATWRRSLVAAALVLLAGCMSSSPPQEVRVGLIGSLDELPVYVLQEQGLAGKHGLHLKTADYPGGARIIEDLAAGTLDLSWSVGTVPLLDAAERGIVPDHVVALATNATTDPDHPGVGVVAAPTVRRWADLRGALIGVYAVNSMGGAALRARLRQEGVTDYRFVEISLPNLGLALAGGGVAAVVMPEPFVTQSISRGDGALLDWVVGGAPLPRMVYTVITTRASLPRERPDTVKALLAAHLQAVAWIAKHPDGARSVVARRLGITDELGHRMKLVHWPLDGRSDDRLFASMQGTLIDTGVLHAPIPAERIFERDILDAVLRERPH